MTDRVRLQALIRGDVQGVGFRDWTREQALRIGLDGSATNLRDGRVEVVAEGSRAECDELLVALRGATPGYVEAVESWSEAHGVEGFRIG